MSIFWDRASLLMDKRKIKPADLARLTGKNRSSVSDWLNKGVLPRVDDAVKIADRLGTSVEYLVTGKAGNELAPLERKLLDTCKNLTEPMMLKVIKEAQDLLIMM